MKQLVQHIRSGVSSVMEVPAPQAQPGQILVQVSASLVSAGTERMVVEFAEKGLLEKARSRPDLVRQTIEKARREGALATLEAVQNRLDQPLALGYAVAGTVIGLGVGVREFKIGDRVAAAGGGHAVHAEVVAIPLNLAVHLPDGVLFEAAAFTTLGAIALQGLRLSKAKLGETVAVIGLGLLGQLTVQLLCAAGCRVLGMDLQAGRAQLAEACGAAATATHSETFAALCANHTGGRGVDAVLITADTKSDEPVTLAGEISRDKGVVVAVGAVGMNLPRKAYYEKELDFRISRSYGPGRYDQTYEEQGRDYPFGYVRWTENRNMQAFVQLLSEGRLDVKPLITHRLPIAEGTRAYEVILGKTGEPFLGVVLMYSVSSPALYTRVEQPTLSEPGKAPVTVGLLGAGNFAKTTLLPAIQRAGGAALVAVCAASGLSAQHVADRFQFRYATTDPAALLRDPAINTVIIATRHHLHASQVIAALEVGKHVFVEKPLCLTATELEAIEATYHAARLKHPGQQLIVGFNRRFAPLAVKLKAFFADVTEPVILHYRANAGYLPPSHWTQDLAQGGGRLLGEAIHFIDWLLWLTGSYPVSVQAVALENAGRYTDDNFSLHLRFANGSAASILYHANGDRTLGKERVEVHAAGRSAVLTDFRVLELMRGGRRTVERSWLRQDKGHVGEWAAFVQAIHTNGPAPIAFDDIVAGMRTALAAADSLTTNATIPLLAE